MKCAVCSRDLTQEPYISIGIGRTCLSKSGYTIEDFTNRHIETRGERINRRPQERIYLKKLATSATGEEIWLSNFSLFHIIIEEAHDQDFGSVPQLFEEIKAAIKKPEAVYQEKTSSPSQQNEILWYIYYRPKNLGGKMICVVTRNNGDKRELWTAHMVPKIKRRHLEAQGDIKIVYQKEGKQ